MGIKAIKQHGGVTLAQSSDLSGPGFAGMPDSAIASGLIDFAIPVDAMAPKLIESFRSFGAPADSEPERRADADDRAAADARNAIYSILRDQGGHDFSGYKTPTFMRRVRRRMEIRHCETIEAYVECLRGDAGEVVPLLRELLINVTSFFRDPEAFEALQQMVIPRLFERKGPTDAVRVWAPGCSTGEEVFSIAILLREHMETLRIAPRVTIFATDIDEPALAAARAGRYPEALMEGVSNERRQRFFTSESGTYVVTKSVRDLCVFSPHSILRDPPFSRMDLISCRNLLIYLGVEAQRQVFPIMHYALKQGGFLFLGKSEIHRSVYRALHASRQKKLPLSGARHRPSFAHAAICSRIASIPLRPSSSREINRANRNAAASDDRGARRRIFCATARRGQRGRRHCLFFRTNREISRGPIGSAKPSALDHGA